MTIFYDTDQDIGFMLDLKEPGNKYITRLLTWLRAFLIDTTIKNIIVNIYFKLENSFSSLLIFNLE